MNAVNLIIGIGLIIFAIGFTFVAILLTDLTFKNKKDNYESFCLHHNMSSAYQVYEYYCYEEDNSIRTYYHIYQDKNGLYLEIKK